ncbi:MAG: hypothetical protein E6G94_01430 [Alphaproteobacteria bacterium]|nr:MAG: hypothetical protein E6G94_01430 [Alphaproteobacteria bacterium]
MTPGEFNPNSIDAQLATVIQRLGDQDIWLKAIHRQTKLTNGRVTKLEKKWIYVAGLIIGGWFVLGGAWFVFTHWPH